jgi:hypothetical protein
MFVFMRKWLKKGVSRTDSVSGGVQRGREAVLGSYIENASLFLSAAFSMFVPSLSW